MHARMNGRTDERTDRQTDKKIRQIHTNIYRLYLKWTYKGTTNSSCCLTDMPDCHGTNFWFGNIVGKVIDRKRVTTSAYDTDIFTIFRCFNNGLHTSRVDVSILTYVQDWRLITSFPDSQKYHPQALKQLPFKNQNKCILHQNPKTKRNEYIPWIFPPFYKD